MNWQPLDDLIQSRWPAAKRGQVPGMGSPLDAWLVPVPDHPPREQWKGTMPNDVFVIAPTEKKAGLTIHLWHPNQPYLLKDNAEWLKEAGFKPMVGCLQWNRKADVPWDAFARLFKQL